MSESRREETRASEQNAEEEFLRLDWNHDSVEIPRPNRSHSDFSEAVPSIADDQWQERGMPPAGCRPHRMHRIHRMRGHSCQLDADQRELGEQPEWEVRSQWRDQRAFFPSSEFEDWVALAGSSHTGSSGSEGLSEGGVLAPPSSQWFVPGPSQDVEDALRCPELAADGQRCHGRPCHWAVWEDQELGLSYSSYPHLGPCEWSWGRPRATSPCQLAADCQMCNGSPSHITVQVELELCPSCSSYPDLGPYEWSWGRPRFTSRCLGHCPTCPHAHRF